MLVGSGSSQAHALHLTGLLRSEECQTKSPVGSPPGEGLEKGCQKLLYPPTGVGRTVGGVTGDGGRDFLGV